MTTSLKTCFKCHIEQPLDDFYRHTQMADGHLNKCKECAKKDIAKNREENIEYYREYDRKRALMPKRKSLRKRISKQWRKDNPIGYKAHSRVNNALRNGKIKKEKCKICGKEKAEAHHPDYSKPLDVVWLCSVHHKKVHFRNASS